MVSATVLRKQLIFLAALDWPVALTMHMWQALKNGSLLWSEFRELNTRFQQKYNLTNYQFISLKKLFYEHNLDSFINWLQQHEIRVIVWG